MIGKDIVDLVIVDALEYDLVGEVVEAE